MRSITFCFLKPDSIALKLEEEIYRRIENSGLYVPEKRRRVLSSENIAFLYGNHKSKPYYPELENFMRSGEVEQFIACSGSEDAVFKMEILVGDTDPIKAKRGTIRGDLSKRVFAQFPNIYQNLIHSSSHERVSEELEYFWREKNL